MDNELFTTLRKYKISDKKDPVENFITEAFAWLLKNYEDFSDYFIEEIYKRGGIEEPQPKKYKWDTQKYFNGFYLDMICEYNKSAIVFENKAWSYLHQNQLKNYKDCAEKEYHSYKLVLITAHKKQHEQDPDIALCWFEVYKMIDQWIKKQDQKNLFLFRNFQNLLVQEGLGPQAPISHDSIISYYAAKKLKHNTSNLVERLSNKEEETFKDIFNKEEDFELAFCPEKWGRIGLSLLNNWRPGIFIGFLIDGEDHSTTLLLEEKSPDFSIIFTFDQDLHNKYPQNIHYNNFVEYLRREINNLGDWNFYHHIEDETLREKDKNYWHPIHIRKPMLELLRGTKEHEEQEERFMVAAKEILPIIINSSEYRNLKNEFKTKPN